MGTLAKDLRSNRSPREIASREALRFAVQTKIVCPLSNRILDFRNAVLLEDESQDDRFIMVLDGDIWDEKEAVIRDELRHLGCDAIYVTRGPV